MNVLDVMPTETMIPPRPTLEAAAGMLDLRRATYRGFAEVEAEKGLLTPTAWLASSTGQDMARLLILRGFEELTEAVESDSRDHYLEELIDALNYFWSILILDSSYPMNVAHEVLSTSLTVASYQAMPLNAWDLGSLLLQVGPLLATFRNRAWQNHAQSMYFDGWIQLHTFIGAVTRQIAISFASWEELARFYWAKDKVLQFRLRTNY